MWLLCFHYIFIQTLYQNYYVRKQTTLYPQRNNSIRQVWREYTRHTSRPTGSDWQDHHAPKRFFRLDNFIRSMVYQSLKAQQNT